MSQIYTESGAVGSGDRCYRYFLWRTWTSAGPRRVLVFLMLNPSTADGKIDDATIRKCVGFAQRLGYNGIHIVNPFALRSRDPKALLQLAQDRIGPENPEYLRETCRDADVIVGWGRWGSHKLLIGDIDRVRIDLRKNAKPASVRCLGYTACGQPKHPLMLAYNTQLEEYRL